VGPRADLDDIQEKILIDLVELYTNNIQISDLFLCILFPTVDFVYIELAVIYLYSGCNFYCTKYAGTLMILYRTKFPKLYKLTGR
jgi:hypothetical protein